MNDIILIAYPTIAALGALALLGRLRRAIDDAEAKRARVRVPARRPR